MEFVSETKRVEKVSENRVRIVLRSGASVELDINELACLGYFFGRSVEYVIKNKAQLFDYYRDILSEDFDRRSHLRVIK